MVLSVQFYLIAPNTVAFLWCLHDTLTILAPGEALFITENRKKISGQVPNTAKAKNWAPEEQHWKWV